MNQNEDTRYEYETCVEGKFERVLTPVKTFATWASQNFLSAAQIVPDPGDNLKMVAQRGREMSSEDGK